MNDMTKYIRVLSHTISIAALMFALIAKSATAAQNIECGGLIRSVSTGLCVRATSGADAAPVVLSRCPENSEPLHFDTLWSIFRKDDGSHFIRSFVQGQPTFHVPGSELRRMEVQGGWPGREQLNGQLIQIWGANAFWNEGNQSWFLQRRGEGPLAIISQASNKCLDVPNDGQPDNDKQLKQFDCHFGPNQLWTIRTIINQCPSDSQ